MAQETSKESISQLLESWVEIMRKLRERGAIRSGNNPTGDLAEGLIALHYNAELEPNSTAGFDLQSPDGKRIQVKGARTSTQVKSGRFGALRKLDEDPFDLLVLVTFDASFKVISAIEMDIEAVRSIAKYYAHTNAWHLPVINEERLGSTGVRLIEIDEHFD